MGTKLRSTQLLPGAAAWETRRALGNTTLAKEESWDVWGFLTVDHFVQDIRYALRTLGRNPGFSAVTIGSLALGVAGTASIFSIVDALLLRPLPFRDSSRLFVTRSCIRRLYSICFGSIVIRWMLRR